MAGRLLPLLQKVVPLRTERVEAGKDATAFMRMPHLIYFGIVEVHNNPHVRSSVTLASVTWSLASVSWFARCTCEEPPSQPQQGGLQQSSE